MAAYVHDTQFFTTRTAVLAAIIALHVFILWALATGLARKAIEVLAPPIQTDIVEEQKQDKEPPPPPPPRPSGVKTPPKAKFGDTSGYYPEASRRLSEEGSATVKVCVGANGKQTSPPQLVQSSGKERLDQAALNYAKDQRFQPGTEDGKAVDQCLDFRVRFALH